MSELKNVLVAMGKGMAKLPRQDYERIFTEYNIGAVNPLPDEDFYNKVKSHPAAEHPVDEFHIYGFLPGGCSYVSEDTISTIVQFFEKHPMIGVVMCDILDDFGNFQAARYTQPEALNNVPFFARKSVADQLTFEKDDDGLIFQKQLEKLKSEGHIIFHIAKPLLSLKN